MPCRPVPLGSLCLTMAGLEIEVMFAGRQAPNEQLTRGLLAWPDKAAIMSRIEAIPWWHPECNKKRVRYDWYAESRAS
jgi:hypothetical protein